MYTPPKKKKDNEKYVIIYIAFFPVILKYLYMYIQ